MLNSQSLILDILGAIIHRHVSMSSHSPLDSVDHGSILPARLLGDGTGESNWLSNGLHRC